MPAFLSGAAMVGSRTALVAALLCMACASGMLAPPALAAFPGRNGDLAVATHGGLDLLNPATGATRRLCVNASLCGHPAQPRFSPNGRMIAFVDSTSSRPVIIDPDGSCLWCLLGPALTTLTDREAAFAPGGETLTLAGSGALQGISLTGKSPEKLPMGPATGAVWSAQGTLALVRDGAVWVGRPPSALRRLASGIGPSFSPDGRQLALARRGWIWVVPLRGGRQRRLVRGGSPAFSPDGRLIAYIGPDGRVEIVGVDGGRPRRVGSLRAVGLDWQPLPVSDRGDCALPHRARLIASSGEALIYGQGRATLNDVPAEYYGCFRPLGLTRLLLNGSGDPYFAGLRSVRLAGRFAALEAEDFSPGGFDQTLTLDDLADGSRTQLATGSGSYGYGGGDALGPFALDSSGFAAWRETSSSETAFQSIACPSASLCVAGESSGDILSTRDPRGAPARWRSASVASAIVNGIQSVSCPSASRCFAVARNRVLASADPAGVASAWSTTVLNGRYVLGALSCPSASLCAAGDADQDTILISTDPAGGADSWRALRVGSASGAREPAPAGIEAVSCPSRRLCVAGERDGEIIASSDPAEGAASWHVELSGARDGHRSIKAISCPSNSFCAAVGSQPGELLTSSDPTGGSRAWRLARLEMQAPEDVYCRSRSLCLIVAGSQILSSRKPAGGSKDWHAARLAGGQLLSAVSCASASLCVIADEQDGNMLSSTDPAAGARAWSGVAVAAPPCAWATPRCLGETLIVRDDQGTLSIDSTPPDYGRSIAALTLSGNSLTLRWRRDGVPRQIRV